MSLRDGVTSLLIGFDRDVVRLLLPSVAGFPLLARAAGGVAGAPASACIDTGGVVLEGTAATSRAADAGARASSIAVAMFVVTDATANGDCLDDAADVSRDAGTRERTNQMAPSPSVVMANKTETASHLFRWLLPADVWPQATPV